MEVPVGPAQHCAMKRNLLIVLAAASLPVFSNGSSNDPRRLTIRVMDYTGLSAATLGEVETSANRILRSAGVNVAFMECYSHAARSGADGCSGSLGRTDVVLRILQPKFAVKGEQLGYVAMSPEGGAYVTVFIDPAEQKARVSGLTNGTFLGHAVAHEIGHLLLGASSHSPSGIMRPAWRSVDEEWMVKGVLMFDAGQASRMRTALAGLRQ